MRLPPKLPPQDKVKEAVLAFCNVPRRKKKQQSTADISREKLCDTVFEAIAG